MGGKAVFRRILFVRLAMALCLALAGLAMVLGLLGIARQNVYAASSDPTDRQPAPEKHASHPAIRFEPARESPAAPPPAPLLQGDGGPDVITVCLESMCEPYTNVQAAVSAVAPGGTVKVAAGVYEDTDADGVVVEITKTLTLQGGYTTTDDWSFPNPEAHPTELNGQGAVRVISISADAAPTVQGFRIRDGNADRGAGVYVSGGSPTLQGNRIHDNVADTNGCGLYIADGSPLVLNNLFYNNRSEQANAKGGGVYVAGGSPLLQHNTFYSNAVSNGGNGGGIYAAAGSAPVISATILVSNAASSGGGIYAAVDAHPELGYNDLWSNTGGNTAGAGLDGVSVFASANPLFVDTPGGDLRLSAGSPCIDQVPVTQTVGLDYEGRARPFGAHSDIGAHEHYYTGTCYVRLAAGRVYSTVQAAVDAAGSGDLIEIAGTCAGVEVRGELTQTVYLSRGLTLRGGYTVTGWSDPDWERHTTVLDAQGQGRVVYVNSTEVVTVEGLHIRNAFITGTLEDSGGGIYLKAGEHVVRHNEIYSNAANSGGGGIYVNSSARVHDNDIYSNTAHGNEGEHGGGGVSIASSGAFVYENVVRDNEIKGTGSYDGGGGIDVRANATVENNIVYDNQSSNDGGGINMHYTDAIVRENSIYQNSAARYGGGVHVYHTSSGAIVEYNDIYENTASGDGNNERTGGGIYTEGSESAGSGPTIQYNTITTNTALSYDGGGIFVRDYSLIRSNTILNNSAAQNGGGIAATTASSGNPGPTIEKNQLRKNYAFTAGGGIWTGGNDKATIENNLIQGNTSGDGINIGYTALVQNNTIDGNTGHGLDWRGAGAPILRNNVIVNNTGNGVRGPSSVTCDYCDVWGNASGEYGGSASGGTGSLSQDPQFASPGQDFHLQTGSPCIDGADPNASNYPDDDLDGVDRPIGSRADMGAYEFPPGTCFARIGDTGQVYTNVQTAIRAASPGADVRVAGLCRGVSASIEGGETLYQTVTITRALTLRGGYTVTNWTTPTIQAALDARGLGRVIYITGTGAVMVDGFIIQGGQAVTGGGMYVATDLNPTIQNVVFFSNSADYGGGFCSSEGDPRLYNNTFVSNTATEDGGAIYLGAGSPVVSNTIVVSNTAPPGGGGGIFAATGAFPTLDYNDVWQNTGGNYEGNATAAPTDFSDDPQFVDFTTFHLQSDSPCMHAGDPGTALKADLEGDERPLGRGYDVGADESTNYPDLSFAPDLERFSSPGEVVVHTHFLTNTGSISETFDLTSTLVTSGTGWQTDHGSALDLAAGERAAVPVVVQVPSDAISGTYATIVITASSRLNPDINAVVYNTTLVNWSPGVDITPVYAEQVNPGAVKSYVHTLSNTGNASDTFAIEHSSSYGWAVITPTQNVAVGPRMTTTLWVTVNVPATAPGGLVETVIVTATSINPLSGVSAEVTDTTEVNHTAGPRYVGTGGYDTLNNCLEEAAPCATIAHAVGQAVNGDSVRVAAGTYTEFDIDLNKDITLRGGYSADYETFDPETYRTMVDAQGQGRVFHIFGEPTVEGLTIRGGSTLGSGGGVYVGLGSPILRRNVITGNTAGTYGGGIYNEGGDPTLERNVLAANAAQRGGGFATATGNPDFWNNVVHDNTASAEGGGVYVAGGSPRVWHDTLYGNSADRGGGIYLNGSGSPTVKNTIVAENTAVTSGGGIYNQAAGATFDYNDVWNNTNGDRVGASAGANSISEDPDFVSETTRDFHLWPTSPCVDEGVATSVTEDLDGQPRIMGSGPDIGADEHGRAGVELEPSQARNGDPGVTLTYSHTVTNTGNYTDTFSFDAHSSLGWDLKIPDPVDVGPDSAETVEVLVEIRDDAIAYTTDTTVLTATSAMNADESDTAVDTTTVNRTLGASWKG